MSTRAIIAFEAEDNVFYVDRSHDGFPEDVLPDIELTLQATNKNWSGAELGQLVSFFLGMHFDDRSRIQTYEPCIGFSSPGDESYRYFVKWNESEKVYKFGVE